MKLLISLILPLITNTACIAQSVDTIREYYNYNWEKCLPPFASYYRLAYKEEKYWRVKDYHLSTQIIQMKGLYLEYDKGEFKKEQGMFFYYHPNGKISEKVRYIDGAMEGVLKKYDTNGVITDSFFFKKDIPVKVGYRWKDKKLIYKGVYDEIGSGAGEGSQYYENGQLSDYWKFCSYDKYDSVSLHYYYNGKLSCKEYYNCGKRLKRECFDTTGTFTGNDCDDSDPSPMHRREFRKKIQNIKDKWIYAVPDEIKPLKGTIMAPAIIKMCVDEKGIVSFSLLRSIHPKVDKFFNSIFIDFPIVKPATEYKRPVSACEIIDIPFEY